MSAAHSDDMDHLIRYSYSSHKDMGGPGIRDTFYSVGKAYRPYAYDETKGTLIIKPGKTNGPATSFGKQDDTLIDELLPKTANGDPPEIQCRLVPQRCYSLHQYGLGTGEAPVELRNNLVPSSLCIVPGNPDFWENSSKHHSCFSEVHNITVFPSDVVRVISAGQARFNEQNRHGQQIQEDRADAGTTGEDSTHKQEAENETSTKPNTGKSIPPCEGRDAADLVVRSDIYRQKQIRLPFSQGSTSYSIVHQTPDPQSETPTIWHLRPLRELSEKDPGPFTHMGEFTFYVPYNAGTSTTGETSVPSTA